MEPTSCFKNAIMDWLLEYWTWKPYSFWKGVDYCSNQKSISDWTMWTCDDRLEPFQHGRKCELELLVNRMLSRAFFAHLHVDELLEVLVSIHGRKKIVYGRGSHKIFLYRKYLLSTVFAVFLQCSFFIFRIPRQIKQFYWSLEG